MKQSEKVIQSIIEDEIDLREIFQTIVEKKKFLLVFTFIALVGSISYVLIAPKVYSIKAMVDIGNAY